MLLNIYSDIIKHKYGHFKLNLTNNIYIYNFVYYRYLDYDVVRMRNNDDIIEYQRSLDGSYQPILIQPGQQENRAKKTENEGEHLKRNRRSLYFNKKGRPYTANRKIRKVKLALKSQ